MTALTISCRLKGRCIKESIDHCALELIDHRVKQLTGHRTMDPLGHHGKELIGHGALKLKIDCATVECLCGNLFDRQVALTCYTIHQKEWQAISPVSLSAQNKL